MTGVVAFVVLVIATTGLPLAHWAHLPPIPRRARHPGADVSAQIMLRCNTEWRYGGCTGQLITDAHTTGEARAAARERGWRCPGGGRDYCPACSGHGPQPADAVVAVLHPRGEHR
ncbi:hypothetical protein [Streptomyces sp. LNU-CPARS28]|uniref:hypothetical protein n=1 Tax=Streptomyces sp. LNU-CPARS28 TaxID=3137371 RepID=UPI003137259E